MLLTGKGNYKPHKGMEDMMHVIGDGDNPIMILKKGEVPKLFDENFFYMFNVWNYFHNGFGLPDGKSFSEYDPELINGLLSFEQHYKAHFETSGVIVKYLEAIIKRLDAYMGGKKTVKRRR